MMRYRRVAVKHSARKLIHYPRPPSDEATLMSPVDYWSCCARCGTCRWSATASTNRAADHHPLGLVIDPALPMTGFGNWLAERTPRLIGL